MSSTAPVTLRPYGAWLVGLLSLSALIVVAMQFSELERFVELARGVKPGWFVVALLAEVATYAVAAGVWQRALAAAGYSVPIRSLVPLGIAKIFTDQAMPSAGLSGMLLLARGLARRGIRSQLAAHVLLVSLVSFYASYVIAALAALALLAANGRSNPALVSATGVFVLIAIAVPGTVLWVARLSTRSVPRWLLAIPGMRALVDSFAQTPRELLRDPHLFLETFALHSAVFVLDSVTYWLIFYALGVHVPFGAAYTAFVMASVIATLSFVPLGLGTFEAGALAVLSLLGVEVEVSLSATLLLRGLTFWLPMLPGLWLARHEMRVPSADAGA